MISDPWIDRSPPPRAPAKVVSSKTVTPTWARRRLKVVQATCLGCGRVREVAASNYRKERRCRSCSASIHGHARTGRLSPTYRSWASMIDRCSKPYSSSYEDYGGRGITVCERWLGEHGFENFLADMGERPAGKTLDRYPNKDGNYEQSNCRWATPSEQARNRRNTKITPTNMERAREMRSGGKPYKDIARLLGVEERLLRSSLRARRRFS